MIDSDTDCYFTAQNPVMKLKGTVEKRGEIGL